MRRRFGDTTQALTAWNGGIEYAIAGARRCACARAARSPTATSCAPRCSSGGIECAVARDLSLGAGGGVRTTTDDRSAFTEEAPWWNLEADWAVAGGWSVAGSFEQEEADAGRRTGATGGAYRF